MSRKVLFGIFYDINSIPASTLAAHVLETTDWEVEIHTFREDASEQDIHEQLQEFSPDLVALSFKTFERFIAFLVAKCARERGIPVICGGIHPSVAKEDVVGSQLFDAVVVGDGMGVMGDILANYKSISGSRVVYGKEHPDRSAYAKRYFTRHQRKNITDSRIFEIMTSHGCFYNCTFCSTDRKFRKIPIEECARQLVESRREMEFEFVHMHDDIFALNVRRIREFRKYVQERGVDLSYHVNARATLFTREIAEELKLLNAKDVVFGIETGSPRLARFLKKEGTVDDAKRAATICREFGLPFKINLIFGLPTQDREDYERTMDLVEELNPDTVALCNFVPFPGSELFKYCLEHRYMPEDWSFDDYLGKFKSLENFYRQNFGVLKNVDYELAGEYRRKVENFMNKKRSKIVQDVVDEIGGDPWILFGTGDYFNRILEIVGSGEVRADNFSGYFDFNQNMCRDIEPEHKLRRYRLPQQGLEKGLKIVITTQKDGPMGNLVRAQLKKHLSYEGDVYSVASYH